MTLRWMATATLLLVPATALAHSYCEQFDDCCDAECYVDCDARPGATEACKHAHIYDHRGGGGDFCVGTGCIYGSVQGCNPVVPNGTTLTCTESVRSCGTITGSALCTSPSATDPNATNNQCVVTDPTGSGKTKAHPNDARNGNLRNLRDGASFFVFVGPLCCSTSAVQQAKKLAPPLKPSSARGLFPVDGGGTPWTTRLIEARTTAWRS
jgi:hypothetical protein